MPHIIEKTVYTFDELSDKAKETAREWMRDCEREDWEPCMEPYESAAGILGIEFNTTGRRDLDIRYSGFWSQGDGASFTGRYSHAPQSPTKIREQFPTETSLHAIADGLNALQCGHFLLTGHRLEAKIETGRYGGSYVLSGTMNLESVTDSETGEDIDDQETEKRILELMRDFANWIYKGLEEDYGLGWELTQELIDRTESAMDEIVLAAYAEQFPKPKETPWTVVDNENAEGHDGPPAVGEQVRVVARCQTEALAVAWLETQDQAKVARGGYGIDGPEEEDTVREGHCPIHGIWINKGECYLCTEADKPSLEARLAKRFPWITDDENEGEDALKDLAGWIKENFTPKE